MFGIDRAGFPFVGGAVAFAVLAWVAGSIWYAVPFILLALGFVYFFRDPDRTTPVDLDAIIAPADGRVVVAGDVQPDTAPPGEWRQISIFLSPLDVHVNRAPASGLVTRVDYRPGAFLPAYKPDAASKNERNELWIDHDGQTIVCRQVVGMLARRIVCRIAQGARLQAGQRFGLMKFGSRMDLFLPPSAAILVHVDDTVRAGETIMARLVKPSAPVVDQRRERVGGAR